MLKTSSLESNLSKDRVIEKIHRRCTIDVFVGCTKLISRMGAQNRFRYSAQKAFNLVKNMYCSPANIMVVVPGKNFRAGKRNTGYQTRNMKLE